MDSTRSRNRYGEHTFLLQRVGWRLALRDVDDAMHVEADFFGICRPMLVAEAVGVLSVLVSVEGVVPGGHGPLVDTVLAGRVLNLL